MTDQLPEPCPRCRTLEQRIAFLEARIAYLQGVKPQTESRTARTPTPPLPSLVTISKTPSEILYSRWWKVTWIYLALHVLPAIVAILIWVSAQLIPEWFLPLVGCLDTMTFLYLFPIPALFFGLQLAFFATESESFGKTAAYVIGTVAVILVGAAVFAVSYTIGIYPHAMST